LRDRWCLVGLLLAECEKSQITFPIYVHNSLLARILSGDVA
jgi:hypothetical protein